MEDIVFGLDIGTTKICALVGAVRNRELRIIGLGMQPSAGMRKGMIVDVPAASVAVAAAVEAAEKHRATGCPRRWLASPGSTSARRTIGGWWPSTAATPA